MTLHVQCLLYMHYVYVIKYIYLCIMSRQVGNFQWIYCTWRIDPSPKNGRPSGPVSATGTMQSVRTRPRAETTTPELLETSRVVGCLLVGTIPVKKRVHWSHQMHTKTSVAYPICLNDSIHKNKSFPQEVPFYRIHAADPRIIFTST